MSGLHGAGLHLALLRLWQGDPHGQPLRPDGRGREVPPRLPQVRGVRGEAGGEDGDPGQGEQALLHQGL